MNPNGLIVAPKVDCPTNEDGIHQGMWTHCRPRWEGRTIIHRASFTCVHCGQKTSVQSISVELGGTIPEGFL